jgi:Barrel-sandwich domain of CusB or HlyD membrane-fusion
MPGMQFPFFQIGDAVRAGMALAQVTNRSSWEIIARLGELDRGYLAVGQKARIQVVALPDEQFDGKVTSISGTTGRPWNRRLECKLSLQNPSDALRPGMSVTLVITTQTLEGVLWLPSQALFEGDGRYFVYLQQNGIFSLKDVKLVRRSESQVVIEGLNQGPVVALSDSKSRQKEERPGGALGSLPRT